MHMMLAFAASDGGATTTHRLASAQSPYLQQHANNPVDWYPWGSDALERARREQKPIFLSIGYSTCHWCHVMAHESFENEAIATLLNTHFIAIKVDREERPDLDHLYMAAVQAMTGQGGWPLSVFLTPAGEPFFGGTYFPPDDRWGRPGFASVLQRIASLWAEDRDRLDGAGRQLADHLRGLAQETGAAAAPALEPALLTTAVQELQRRYDRDRAGFGMAPKFPMPHQISFLLRYAARHGDAAELGGAALAMARGTLDALAAGGIHDHLGGGFHRYATDADWRVPHFEKMLYDQAGLALAFTEAWLLTRDELYARTTRDILDYVLGYLTAPAGGFFSAEDADSEGEEGRFYLWRAAEIDAALEPEAAAAFKRCYDFASAGDGAAHILYRNSPRPAPPPEIAAAQRTLLAARDRRVRPHRDDKIVTAWNGYMIAALARAGGALDEPRYTQAAARAAAFAAVKLWSHGRLMRHYRDGTAPVPGYLEDYAYLCRGLLALYEARYEPRYLSQAAHAARELLRLFAEPSGRLRFRGGDDDPLLAPVIDVYDGALPSGYAVAAGCLLRLGHLLGDRELEAAGERAIAALFAAARRAPTAHLELLSAYDFMLGPVQEVVVSGDPEDPRVARLLAEIHGRYLPRTVSALRPPGAAEAIEALIPYLAVQRAPAGQAAAFVCRDYACRLPVHDAPTLGALLDER